MKHEQVFVDYWTMFKATSICLVAICGYVLLKMIHHICCLPRLLKKNQLGLEEMAKQFANDLGEEENVEMEKLFNSSEPLTEERIKQLLEKSANDSPEEPKKEL